nr:hypothetical protein [Tanacetum cinerariifolium]
MRFGANGMLPRVRVTATLACGSHVSRLGTATSADSVPLAYVAATSAADVEIAKSTQHPARTRDLPSKALRLSQVTISAGLPLGYYT